MVRATFLVALFVFFKYVIKHQNIFGILMKINYIRNVMMDLLDHTVSDIYIFVE